MPTDPPRPARPARPPRLVAHRGASGSAPENTLAAFRRAGALGASWVEFDVTLLGDGTPVIFHDATLDRTTDRTGPLNAIGRADLATIDAGLRFGPAFAGERIPTLAETLALLRDAGLSANIELKPHGASVETAAAVADALAGMAVPLPGITVSSFDHRSLAAFREHAPSVPVAPLFETPAPGWRETAAALRAEAVHVGRNAADAALVAAAHAAGLALRCYTVNDRAEAARLAAAAGVDAIFTDYPERFLGDPYWGASP